MLRLILYVVPILRGYKHPDIVYVRMIVPIHPIVPMWMLYVTVVVYVLRVYLVLIHNLIHNYPDHHHYELNVKGKIEKKLKKVNLAQVNWAAILIQLGKIVLKIFTFNTLRARVYVYLTIYLSNWLIIILTYQVNQLYPWWGDWIDMKRIW